jgi:hypothetical protein
VFEHDQRPGDVLELLAGVLADRRPLAAAARAGAVGEGDVVDDPLAGQGRRQGLAAVARGLGIGRRRAARWGQGGHRLDRGLRREEEQLAGIDRLALPAIPLPEEQFELVLEAGDELVLLAERPGQLADRAVGGVEVAGE